VERKTSYEIDSYRKINMIFMAIIMFVFFYSFMLPYLSFGFRSSCEGMPLSYCKSRGLTRAFSQILRLNFEQAVALNPYSIKIFLFFFVQLIARFSINTIVRVSNFKKVVTADICCSGLFFIFSFYNLVMI